MNAKNELALFGGEPVRRRPFPRYNTIGDAEKRAVARVLDSGTLSKFMGGWCEGFYGGPEVRALEADWCAAFGVEHAVSVNSASSALVCALGAAEVGPGDEVIVTPFSMCISATAPLFWGAIPVFADIEPSYYCLAPESVEARITPRTKAIVAVDIFGQPCDFQSLRRLADRHGLILIEDASQAPLAHLHGQRAGTLGHIGVFSLNCHKHIHCGEGGIAVSNAPLLAERLRLIRNHAEVVAGPKGETNLVNLVGHNMRMTELEAAIAREQLKKLPELVNRRLVHCQRTIERLTSLPAIRFGGIRPRASHCFYLLPLLFDAKTAGCRRDRFLEAVRAELAPTEGREAEGVKIYGGYVAPIYLLPLFQQRIALGREGFPFTLAKNVTYRPGLCPVAEELHRDTIFCDDIMHAMLADEDIDDVAAAFEKVWQLRQYLLEYGG